MEIVEKWTLINSDLRHTLPSKKVRKTSGILFALLITLVINYYDTIEERRTLSTVEPGYLKKLLPDGPPEKGEKWDDIQKDIEAKIMPGITHWWGSHNGVDTNLLINV